MNISLSEEGKNMSFKEFAKVFGKHFNVHSSPDIEKTYTELTGKKVGNSGSKRKKDQEV